MWDTAHHHPIWNIAIQNIIFSSFFQVVSASLNDLTLSKGIIEKLFTIVRDGHNKHWTEMSVFDMEIWDRKLLSVVFLSELSWVPNLILDSSPERNTKNYGCWLADIEISRGISSAVTGSQLFKKKTEMEKWIIFTALHCLELRYW